MDSTRFELVTPSMSTGTAHFTLKSPIYSDGCLTEGPDFSETMGSIS